MRGGGEIIIKASGVTSVAPVAMALQGQVWPSNGRILLESSTR